ncbi:uncharacterized protein F5147DRAFT_814342 [Suillus discolor]|uniref:Fungal-type protein kinase domain-containing protein n=1 Tax=Suillus discolor TaxID=1912936 RepID=A0A9P7F0E8_9AGAM|nr:uncharacterized protein F5147DRAFT_814342 [Suillus discolor]KAG2099254.1 hypothetical protein F5147DRAFT_814342 [Suillus discolor]
MLSNTAVSSLVDINRLLCGRISSIGVPVGELPRTLDIVKPLLKRELQSRVIHEGVGNAVQLQFKNSIFNQIVPQTNIEVESLGLIKYDRLAGPSAYSSKGWKFNHRKRVKRTEESDSETDGLEDDEGSATEIDEDIEDNDDDTDNGGGSKLNYEGSLGSAILGKDELLEGSWDGQDFQAGSKKRRRRVVHTTETDLQRLFYTIQYHLRNSLKDNIPYTFAMGARYWTAEFSTTAIPDSFNAWQKPDLSLFDFTLLKEKKSWANVLAFVEHTSSDLSKNRGLAVYWGSAIKAYLIIQEQPWRRFVLAYSICANMLRAHYFDRSGVIISLPFNIHKSPGSIRLCDVLAALTLPDSRHLGLDPTIHMCHAVCNGTHVDLADGAIGWVEDNNNNVYSIMAVLWKSHGFFCRGTVCYRVRNKEGTEYALKDCWVEELKKMHEPTVLRMVKGIPNIVELIDDWDVYYEGQPDCTARIREIYDQDQRDDTAFCNRFHRRLLLSPCGEPLSQFSSRTELIVAFRHFVIAHQAMIERRVLHGDLSPNNFVMHDGIGYFIDLDHTTVLAVNTTSTYSPGTGTMPYISIWILQSMMKMIDPNVDNNDPSKDVALANAVERLIEHRPSDDLESLFYIFFEFVAKYGGAHGELAPSWTRDSLPWASAYEALGKADLKGALGTVTRNPSLTTTSYVRVRNLCLSVKADDSQHSVPLSWLSLLDYPSRTRPLVVTGTCYFTKVGVVLDPTFMVETTSDYFATFRPLIQHWQALVCLANKPDEKERVETTHNKVLEVLTAFIDTYVEVAPINPSASSNPIPEVGSGGDNPPIGRPPIPEAGPSRLSLRRSTRNLHKSR